MNTDLLKTTGPLAVLLLAAPLAAGQSWQRQYPVPQPHLRDVEAPTALEGWAVGDGGLVLHTSNGGTNWSETQLPAAVLEAVDVVGTHAWVAGDGIHRSTDFGQTWTKVAGQKGLWDVVFVDASHGFACGDESLLLRSTDGGGSWTPGADPGATGSLRAACFLDPATGWVAGDQGELFHTLDGGSSWVQVQTGVTEVLTDVQFLDALVGWVAAGSRTLRTTDGGATWTEQPVPAGVAIEAVRFLTADIGWCAGPSGEVLRTGSGGDNWKVKLETGGNALHDVDMGDLQNGFAVGASGSVYRSTDSGQTWAQVHGGSASAPPGLRSLAALDDGLHAWAGGWGGIVLRTTDGGQLWDPVFTGDANTVFSSVDFFDPQHGFAIGEKQGFYPTTAWTTDGGLNWIVTNHLGQYDMNDVDALGLQTALVCTSSYIWRTTDSGQTWDWHYPPPGGGYRAADFVDAQNGWVVSTTTIYRTTDGGQSYTPIWSPTSIYRDLSFADAQHGWAVGDGGKILRTTDGGQTWSAQSSGTGGDLLDVEATGPHSAWVAGAGGYVARTSDGGATWTLDTPDAGNDYSAARFTGPSEGWVVAAWPDTGIWRREATADCSAAAYCAPKTNSLGMGPTLSAQGTPSVAAGSFDVVVRDAVPSKPGLFITSDLGPASIPLFNGTLCVEPPFKRLPVLTLDGTGSASVSVAVTPELVGTTRWFQFWYRDTAHPDGTGVGLSGGLEVTFCE